MGRGKGFDRSLLLMLAITNFLTVLKLLGVIDWSWILILLPIGLPIMYNVFVSVSINILTICRAVNKSLKFFSKKDDNNDI